MKVAVMGCGTVGSGAVEILENKKELLAAKCGEPVELKYILDIRDLSDRPYGKKAVKDIGLILNDPEIGVVVETMGGLKPAFDFCLQCLNAGKSVVTSNKEMVAVKGDELLAAARANNVCFAFEAAVCGGIPLIRTMFSDLGANRLMGFDGIMNGTTNFILTKMIKEKMSFDTALKLAQELGFAEKDPTADVEGIDACRKTAILASIAFGTHVLPEEIPTEGITRITLEDAAYAADANAEIKLICKAERLPDGKVYAAVCPAFVSRNTMIANVSGVNNAVAVRGDSVGEVFLYGPGAGKEATASAVIGDVLACVRLKKNEDHYYWAPHREGVLCEKGENTVSLYVRGYAKHMETAAREIRETFDSVRFLSRDNAPANELAFITGNGREKDLFEAVGEIRDFASASVIRVLS